MATTITPANDTQTIIARALATRTMRKADIEGERTRKLKDADKAFAQVIHGLRERNVPWREISVAADMSRQALADLLREHCS